MVDELALGKANLMCSKVPSVTCHWGYLSSIWEKEINLHFFKLHQFWQ